mmetsp:Transcript_37409/g.49615  ORF Transcript_37409/g.49615 Transcript_37409/m.49615 type:complete len:275 (+) Transcript_37409:184-1008(+)
MSSSFNRRRCFFLAVSIFPRACSAFLPLGRTTTTTSSSYRNGLSRTTSLWSQSLSMDYSSTSGADDTKKPVLRPLIVCGPSGVGKGTIISEYMEKYNGSKHFGFTVSHTTRAPRPGEVDGIHYHFSTRDQMLDSISKGEFLEHAEVHGNLYGTSLDAVMHVQKDLGKYCLLDIDVQGVKKIKETTQKSGDDAEFELDPNYIFIAPPSVDTLRERLVGRGTETEETLARRTKNAVAELEYGLEEGNFDFIVTNGDLEEACRDFERVVRELYGDLS